MNTYQQLVEMVLPNIKSYQNDLLVHDKNTLETYTGKFLYGYRDTGTNIQQFVLSVKDFFKQHFIDGLDGSKESSISKIREALINTLIWITYSNTTFMYFDGSKFHYKTKEQIELLWREHVEQVCNKLYQMNEGSERLVSIF